MVVALIREGRHVHQVLVVHDDGGVVQAGRMAAFEVVLEVEMALILLDVTVDGPPLVGDRGRFEGASVELLRSLLHLLVLKDHLLLLLVVHLPLVEALLLFAAGLGPRLAVMVRSRHVAIVCLDRSKACPMLFIRYHNLRLLGDLGLESGLWRSIQLPLRLTLVHQDYVSVGNIQCLKRKVGLL